MIVKTYDVFCDWSACMEWVHGVVRNARASDDGSREARKVARRAGWRRIRDPETAKWRDLCPVHVERSRQRRDI